MGLLRGIRSRKGKSGHDQVDLKQDQQDPKRKYIVPKRCAFHCCFDEDWLAIALSTKRDKTIMTIFKIRFTLLKEKPNEIITVSAVLPVHFPFSTF
jgi:hypothetical protein